MPRRLFISLFLLIAAAVSAMDYDSSKGADYHFDGGYMSVRPSYGATPPGQAPVYYANCHYFIHDYQGRSALCDASRLKNNRLVVDGSDNIEQTNEYYPYGRPWGTSSTNQGFQPFKYNGRSALCDASHLKKELDRVHGLDWYDYGAYRNFMVKRPLYQFIFQIYFISS